MKPLGAWLEQLIAESSGKQGRGILPVDGEQVAAPGAYGDDRLFAYLRREGEFDPQTSALQAAGQPVLIFNIPDNYDLGAEFYRWEVATAFACAVLRVNAFDQPDVQDSKDRTKAKINAYNTSKRLDEGKPLWDKKGVRAYSTMPLTTNNLKGDLLAFMASARIGDYVAINAYLPRNPEMVSMLESLQLIAREKTACATTVGFGPRFLHSTGQMHKGGPDTGLFLQITADPVTDLEIPGQGMQFSTLERAQALGDYEALAARGRRILRINLPSPDSVKLLVKALQ